MGHFMQRRVPHFMRPAAFAAALRRRSGLHVAHFAVANGSTVTVTDVEADDYVVGMAQRTSAGLPPGQPAGWTNVLDGAGGGRGFRIAFIKATSAMGSSFAAGSFSNAARTRCWVVRGASGIGSAAGSSLLTTERAFSPLAGVGPGSLILGFNVVSAGSPILPEGATGEDSNTFSISWRSSGLVSAWSPSAGAAGGSATWTQAAVEIEAA